MKASEGVHHEDFNRFESQDENQGSNFWGIAFMVAIFVIVIAALALLLL